MTPRLPALLSWAGLALCVACGAPQPIIEPEPLPAEPIPEPVAYEHQFAPPPQTLFSSGGAGAGPGGLKGSWYTVKRGDYISAIAQRNGVPMEDIVEINGLTNPEKLEVGQKLFLPNVDRPKVAARTTARQTTARQPAATVQTRARRAPYIWPVRSGELVSYFGKRGSTMHKGIDIKAPLKTKIYAIADGKVIYSNNTQPGYGNLIIIRHDDEVVSVYAHNRVNRVDEGDRVRQGQEIAEVGQTGRTRTPHLHFEFRVKGKAQNPLVRLPATNNLNR